MPGTFLISSIRENLPFVSRNSMIIAAFLAPIPLSASSSVAEALLMLILGGSGSLFGPAIGSGIIVLLENLVSGITERWSLVLGIVYVAVIMLYSEGIFSIIKRGR